MTFLILSYLLEALDCGLLASLYPSKRTSESGVNPDSAKALPWPLFADNKFLLDSFAYISARVIKFRSSPKLVFGPMLSPDESGANNTFEVSVAIEIFVPGPGSAFCFLSSGESSV